MAVFTGDFALFRSAMVAAGLVLPHQLQIQGEFNWKQLLHNLFQHGAAYTLKAGCILALMMHG